MTAAEGFGSIAALGGAGGVGQVALHILGRAMSMGTAARDRKRKEKREDAEDNATAWQNVTKMAGNVVGDGSPWVYRMFAVVCMFIMVSPMIWGVVFDNVVLHFYVPKDPGFWGWFGFDTAKMIEYPIPSEYGPDARHVALYPFMYSFAGNVAWFFMAGRPLKQ